MGRDSAGLAGHQVREQIRRGKSGDLQGNLRGKTKLAHFVIFLIKLGMKDFIFLNM